MYNLERMYPQKAVKLSIIGGVVRKGIVVQIDASQLEERIHGNIALMHRSFRKLGTNAFCLLIVWVQSKDHLIVPCITIQTCLMRQERTIYTESDLETIFHSLEKLFWYIIELELEQTGLDHRRLHIAPYLIWGPWLLSS